MPLAKQSKTPLDIKRVSEDVVENFKAEQWRAVGMDYGMPVWDEETVNFAAYRGSELLAVMTVVIKGAVSEMKQIIVHEEHRHEGIGTDLMTVFEKFSAENHCFRMILKVPEVYKDSVEFYKKHHFKIDAELRDYEYHRNWYWMSRKI